MSKTNREYAIEQADHSPTPSSMYVMGMLSDAQHAMAHGNVALAMEILNDAKAVIDARVSVKDEHGRHDYSQADWQNKPFLQRLAEKRRAEAG